jgi:VCBS repeat-containing protein
LNYSGKFDATFAHGDSGAASHQFIHIDHPPAHAPPDAIVVPDAHFLFNADFKRSGVDLILSGDGRELVLHDYFKGEKRPALASPDGAHLTGGVVTALTGHVDVSQAGTNPAAGVVIGHVSKLQGSCTAVRNGVSIILNNGDNVEKGDVVESGSNSSVGITFIDGTVFGLLSNARMVLNEMVYDANGSNNSTLFNLVAGTITFVAGQTAKHGDMKIDTPVATMGIRGTAVLVQIDFTVPGQTAAPNASFQVLVEPDGTTGSYVLFDKTTLQPVATVNQAGVQTNIANGVISQSNAPLSPDIQKLIQDVFSQKFTDNSNTKHTSPGNDTLNPLDQGLIIKTADGAAALPTFLVLKGPSDSATTTNSTTAGLLLFHIAEPPTAIVLNQLSQVTTSFATAELIGRTGDGALDSVGGIVRFTDINAADRPTVSVDFTSFTYRNASQVDVTGKLSPVQLADIAATAVQIAVAPDPGNNNNGSATWTYSIADKAFDFLGAGEQLTLTYLVRVDNNYVANQSAFVPITITVTGTNDAPVFTTSPQTISLTGSAGGPSSGTLIFGDADLSDTHTVSTKLTDAVLDGSELPSATLALLEKALTTSIAKDSTGAGSGTIDWSLGELPESVKALMPKGSSLTLSFAVTVTDSQNASVTQTLSISVNPSVVWIAKAAPDSPPGGFWSDGANWKTGTVPTANDDAVIMTNQLIGLTPSFPVTINAPAVARSITMDDIGSTPPELINLNHLTIGTGGLSLNADSIIHNSGTIDIAGSAEFLGQSVLVNCGTLNLAQGGDFGYQTSITNSGTIKLSGGALNVQTDIANFCQITVDNGATLALNGGGIDGGKVTINGTLELDGGSFLKNGALDNSGEINVSGSGNLLDAEIVTNMGEGAIDVTGALMLADGTCISGGTLSIGIAGTLEVSTDFGATLSGVCVENSGAIQVDADSVLALSHTLIKGGALADHGTIEVTGDSEIDNTAVANCGALEAVDDSILKLISLVLTNDSKGTVSADISSTLDLVDSIIKGGTIDVAGTLNSTGNSEIDGATIHNTGLVEVTGGTLTIDAASVLDNHGTLEANGGNLVLEGAASGAIEIAGASTVELGSGLCDAYAKAEIIFADEATGTLKIDHAETFNGEIAGFDDGTLDLTDIAWGYHTTVTFSGDSSGGILTVVDNDDPSQVAHIHLEGDYLGSSWNVANDGSGGTKIAEVPGTISGLNSHGDAVEGQKLTVSITDGGHVITKASYIFETSSNGTDWTVVQSGFDNCYMPTEADEGRQLKVVLSFADGDGQSETSTISAGIVQEPPNSPPVILGESDPAQQTVVLAELPIVLTQGSTNNALGFPTENFDGMSAGSPSDNGHGHGNFFSDVLDATFTASGNAGVTAGTSSSTAAPFIGPLPGHVDDSQYLSVGGGATETISFADKQNAFGLYWGSVDSFNKIDFYDGNTLIASYSGADVSPLLASGGQGSFESNGYVQFKDLAPFDKVVLSSGNTNAFEIDNISAGNISDSHIRLAEPVTGTLTVSDDDVGNTLTAAVTGPAVIKYNGSSSLPDGVNVDALINPDAVTFDSVKSDGKPDVLHWAYQPSNYNLDFLEPGDTLTITFNAQVSDGHVATGSQALTITLAGNGSSVINGSAQNDVFDHVGGGVTIFGHGGNDTFVFNANFGSATIGDFDVNRDTIDIDQSLFKSVSEFINSAQPINFGQDTVITDANHDKIVLTGVTVADVKAHPNDFHLV